MDPSRNLCIIKHNDKFPKYEKHTYRANTGGSPRAVRNNSINYQSNTKEYNFNQEQIYIHNQNLSDPYKTIDTIFPERSSMVLANIDAVFSLTGQVAGYLIPQNTKEYDYGVLGDSKAGYVEYLQYRLPASTGFVFCSKYLDHERISKDNLDIINPTDSSFADISQSRDKYVKYVNTIVPDGLDLLVSNNSLKESLLTALNTLKTGGKMVIRLDEHLLKDQNILDLLYITSMNFENISLTKPLSEDINGYWTYLIAQNYHNQPYQWIELIEENVHMKLPLKLIKYIEEYIESLNNLRKTLHSNNMKDDIIYNMYKCLSIWNMI